jgi:excisionase family DNA binding protein
MISGMTRHRPSAGSSSRTDQAAKLTMSGDIPAWAKANSPGNLERASNNSSEIGSNPVKPTTPYPDEELLSVQEIASYLGISVKSVRRLIGRHELHFLRIGRLIRIRRSDLLSYLNKCLKILILFSFILYRYYYLY